MNAYEYIDQMADVIKKCAQDKDQSETITLEEHNKQMLNMLYILKKEMEDAEYVFEAKRIEHDDYMVFGEYTILRRQLNDGLLIFQPMTSDVVAIDMQSIAEVLSQLRDSGKIQEDMILLPPDVNVLRAVLRKPDTPDNHDESDLPDEFK